MKKTVFKAFSFSRFENIFADCSWSNGYFLIEALEEVLNWYFVEKELYDEAICIYILSFQYEKNQSVQSELFYISQSTGKDIVKPEIDDIKKLAEKYNFPVGADEDLLGLVMYLGKESLKEEVIPAAKYYFGILYRLTEDDDVKEILERLEKGILD
ncbi:MAG: hypothetical protein UH788_07310 [Treponemataceae bacterium]|nr:hypothetical protein [Treponemataceae bacterium]